MKRRHSSSTISGGTSFRYRFVFDDGGSAARRSLCSTVGEVGWPVNRRNALTFIVKPTGVRSAQRCDVAGAGIA